MGVIPEFNSTSLPMNNQIEKHINADDFRSSSDNNTKVPLDTRMQHALTKSNIFQMHRKLLVDKNKDSLYGLKEVTLK